MYEEARLKEQLKKMIIDACRVEGVVPEEIGDTDRLIGGTGVLELDSLDALEISVALQREFGIKIDNATVAADAMRSIESLAAFVSKVSSQSRS
ncbi:MAG: acyl carrier protein [Acidobacteriota bacterium]|nr:acyl carrier protein [Acidobacteriota bacterium]